MQTRVADILNSKGNDVLTTTPSTSVYDAIAKMVDHNVGSIVITEDGEICGIFTERDYLRRIILQGRSSKTTPIEEVMTPDVLYVDPSYTVEDCMAIMTEKKCRHLPVMEEGQLAGIISIGDCVRTISANAQARVQSLTDYIMGKYPA